MEDPWDQGDETEILPLRWGSPRGDPEKEFLAWFRLRWAPGDHLAIIAPTKAGKTTFAVGLLQIRKFVLAFDPKGGDSTLAASGFERITSWPLPRHIRKQIQERQPTRLIVGAVVQNRAERAELRTLQAKVLSQVFDIGGFTVYIDEHQLLSDPRFMHLGADSDELHIAARDREISMVTAQQSTRWASKTSAEQSYWLALSQTRDREIVRRMSEMSGRPAAEVRGILRGLMTHAWALFSRSPYDPVGVTIPAEVKRKNVRRPDAA